LTVHLKGSRQVSTPPHWPSSSYPTSQEQPWQLNLEAVNAIASQFGFWHWSDGSSPVTWIIPVHVPCLSQLEKLPDAPTTPGIANGWGLGGVAAMVHGEQDPCGTAVRV
jgi:hypothetical protein